MERILEEVPYHVFSYQGDSFVAHRGLKRPLKISQEAKSHLERRAAGEQASPENEGLRREISALEESGFFEPCEQPIPTDAEFDRLLRLRYEAPWTKLELALSEVCNLACRYCYCGTCRDEVPNQGRMSETIARAAINWLFAVSGRSKEVGITFFGGEPLMNKKVLLFAVAYSQRLAKLHGKKVFYSMTTNGTLIDDDVISVIKRYNFGLMVSLDGPKERHDGQCPTRTGTGSFDLAVAGIKRLMARRNWRQSRFHPFDAAPVAGRRRSGRTERPIHVTVLSAWRTGLLDLSWMALTLKSVRRFGVSIASLSKDIASDAGPTRFAKAHARGRSLVRTEHLPCLSGIVRIQNVGLCRRHGLRPCTQNNERNRIMKARKLMGTVASLLVAVNASGDVVKGWVRLEATPSIAEVAEEYATTGARIPELAARQIMERQNAQGIKYMTIPVGATVEIQTLPDFKVVGRGKVDQDGNYSVVMPGKDSLWRAYSKVVREEFGRPVLYVGVSRTYKRRNAAYYEANITMMRSYASAMGRCVQKDGTPAQGVFVYVHPITSGETEEECRLCPTQLAVTDTLGRWRVDGLASPPIIPLMSYICYTNIVDNWQVSHYPLQLGIYARRKPFGSYDAERVVPNVTDENHRAVEKTIAATERKSGKKMKRLNPMTNFPVSTNNVIYVPDLVLQ